jgi:hypothetical protein
MNGITSVNTRYFICWLAACALAISRIVSGQAAAQEVPVFQVKAEGEGANATISIQDKTALFDIRSRSGIGRVTVEHVSGPAPDQIVVRLHVKGLEEFRFSHDKAEITARVSSSDGGSVTQSLRSGGGDERQITSANPRWLGVRIVPEQATPRIPLEQGHFEITLPKGFLREGGRSFAIRWIDFYR